MASCGFRCSKSPAVGAYYSDVIYVPFWAKVQFRVPTTPFNTVILQWFAPNQYGISR